MTDKMANNIEKIKSSATHKVNNSAPSTESRHVPNLPVSNPFSMNALTKKKANNLKRVRNSATSRINSGRRVPVGGRTRRKYRR